MGQAVGIFLLILRKIEYIGSAMTQGCPEKDDLKLPWDGPQLWRERQAGHQELVVERDGRNEKGGSLIKRNTGHSVR